MELSLQVQLDGDHRDTWGRRQKSETQATMGSPVQPKHPAVALPFSDCHQAFLRCGAKLVTTFWMRWLSVFSRGEKGYRESHRKHFFSSWVEAGSVPFPS